MIVDAHFHCWRLARGDYGWLRPELGTLYRDVSIDDWLAQACPLGVEAGVLVQAAPTEAETEFLLEQAATAPAVRGVVGWVELLAGDAPARIERLAARPKLRGLRPMLHDLPDPAWMLRPALAPALRAMAAHGLVFDALVRPSHLPHLLALSRQHPSLQVVVDHGAKPDIAAGPWQPWAADLQRLAEQTQAVCKLSGLLTEAGPRPARGAADRWAEHLLKVFGADRLLWGSDWPVLEGAASYRDWWDDTARVLGGLAAGERAAVLGGSAARVYRL